MFGFWKRRRRARILAEPFPPAWKAILDRNVPASTALAEDDRAELERLILVFVAEKTWEGCGGLEVTDEIRVTIAAAACRLLLHRDDDPYPDLQVIRVYPSAFVVHPQRRNGYIVTDGPAVRTGVSWQRGVVVLAWDAVKRGAADPTDGHDVGLHEFAHQLDQASGASDGAPVLPDAGAYRAWAEALGRRTPSSPTISRKVERRFSTPTAPRTRPSSSPWRPSPSSSARNRCAHTIRRCTLL
jgi:Mlc titration factor MtfA (ptsG expression regulator)